MRFYHLPQLLHWTMDEEYWSYIPLNIATGYHFPLIGGSMADTGIYTTPWFVYLMAIVAFIGRGDPVVFGIFVSSLGAITALLVYFLGKKMFGERAAFFAAILYSGSMLMSLWDRHYWNASLTPILSLLVFYFVYKRKLILLALTLALAVSAHGTGMSLFLFAVLALVMGYQKLNIKTTVLAAIIFLLSFSPVFLFEARHNFLELRALATYFTAPKANTQTFPNRTVAVTTELLNTSGKLFAYQDNNDVSSQLTLGDNTLDRGQMQIVSVLMLFLVIVSLKLAKKDRAYQLLWLQVGATVLGLLIFRSPISGYYYTPIAIPLFFLAGTSFDRIWQNNLGKMFGVVLIGIFLWLNMTKMLAAYHSESYPEKLQAVQKAIQVVGNQPFSFDVTCLGHCQPYGFRYLFTYLGHEPVKSYMDLYLSWLYTDRLPKSAPFYEVNFIIKDGKIDLKANKT